MEHPDHVHLAWEKRGPAADVARPPGSGGGDESASAERGAAKGVPSDPVDLRR